MRKDLNRELLYEGVKALVECENNHILLPQQKLFTLFTVSFQYMLFLSTKSPGAYILRVEDSSLFDKLLRKSKDLNVRNFLQKMSLPRKFKYDRSTFYLDFFHTTSWNITKDIPSNMVKGALIVKNTSPNPMLLDTPEEEGDFNALAMGMENDLFLTSLMGTAEKTVTIAFDQNYADTQIVKFPFIKEEAFEHMAQGVKISGDIKFED